MVSLIKSQMNAFLIPNDFWKHRQGGGNPWVPGRPDHYVTVDSMEALTVMGENAVDEDA